MLTARIRGVSETRPDQRSARSPSSLLGESVTGAIQRFDSVELGIELTEFTANPLDVAVDRAVVAIDVAVIRSEEHTSELQSLMRRSYAVFCLQQSNY